MGISGFPHTDAALGMDTEAMSGPLSNVESFLTVSKDSRAIKKNHFLCSVILVGEQAGL